ncbi:MAG: ATP-binding protein, partial [Patescibacteria group bacterium]
TYNAWQQKHTEASELVLEVSAQYPDIFNTRFVETFAVYHQDIRDQVVVFSDSTMYTNTLVDKAAIGNNIHNDFNQLLIVTAAGFNESLSESSAVASNKRIEILFLVAMYFLLILLFSIRINDLLFSNIEGLIEKLKKVRRGKFGVRLSEDDTTEFLEIKRSINFLLEKLQTSNDKLKETVSSAMEDHVKSEKLIDQSEKTKKATLNILEDFADEKDKLQTQVIETLKYKKAVDATNDHIIITDPEGTIIYANSSVERITGFDLDEIIGKKAGSKELWGGHMDKKFYSQLWSTIKKKKQVFAGEIKNRRKNGEFYYAHVSISPVVDENHELLYFVGIERDISAEKEIDMAKTEFVSLASHQLRTPLSAINWYSELMLSEDSGDLNTNQRSYMEEIYTGSQRMVQLVNALLNVSRIELGTFIVDPESADLRVLVDEVINESEKDVLLKNLIIKKQYQDDIPMVDLDVSLTRIMIQNLITNSVKYTPEKGTITVSISVKNDQLVLEVADTGMGIPKAEQRHVFTKLYRADNVKETDTQGTGLGLYTTKSILDHINGSISFTSKEGKGTTFTITIPVSGMKNKEGTRRLQ